MREFNKPSQTVDKIRNDKLLRSKATVLFFFFFSFIKALNDEEIGAEKRPTGNRYFYVFEELHQVNRCSVKLFFTICRHIWDFVLRQVFHKETQYLLL